MKERQLSNNNINNNFNFNNIKNNNSFNAVNNNYMMKMNTHINTLDRYSSTFNSNEFFFKQPFSLNTSAFYKTNKNNLFSSNNEQKIKQIINLNDIAKGIEKRTTIMIRNIPIKYTNEILEKELEFFNGKFDCIYMPFDYEKNGNKGYAFLNLVNPYHVLYFMNFSGENVGLFLTVKKILQIFRVLMKLKNMPKIIKGQKSQLFI